MHFFSHTLNLGLGSCVHIYIHMLHTGRKETEKRKEAREAKNDVTEHMGHENWGEHYSQQGTSKEAQGTADEYKG